MLIQLIMGDWSDDGHGKTVNRFIETNKTRKELKEIYKIGVEIIGSDITELCADYEDNLLPLEDKENFEKAGFVFDPKKYDDYDEDEPVRLWTDTYLELYLFTIKKANPKTVINLVNVETLTIGGYGLFY